MRGGEGERMRGGEGECLFLNEYLLEVKCRKTWEKNQLRSSKVSVQG